ncbi:MAG: hypothetical protein ACRDKJ_04900 [Actinomycetota bacterium]
MARLTYAALALALASLVSGFFIRTTAVPLFASIGLSALVLILILRGWARKLRQTELGEDGEALDEPAIQLEDLDVVEEIEATDFVVVDAGVARTARRRRPRPVATDVLEEQEPRRRPARPQPPLARRPRTTGSARRVVVLPGRKRYHAPGCRFARGKGAEEIAESTARRRHFQPCSVCLG